MKENYDLLTNTETTFIGLINYLTLIMKYLSFYDLLFWVTYGSHFHK